MKINSIQRKLMIVIGVNVMLSVIISFSTNVHTNKVLEPYETEYEKQKEQLETIKNNGKDELDQMKSDISFKASENNPDKIGKVFNDETYNVEFKGGDFIPGSYQFYAKSMGEQHLSIMSVDGTSKSPYIESGDSYQVNLKPGDIIKINKGNFLDVSFED